jgi:ribosomal-protein-alanine N-acetyltransferase
LIIQTPLRSKRLVLRSLKAADIGNSYFRWLRDAEITKYLEVRHTKPSVRGIKKYVEDCNRSEKACLAGIFLRREGTHIGNIKIGPINWRHKRAEIGLFIGERKLHGQGLALEAVQVTSKFCSKKLRLLKLTSGCYASNKASQKLFLRAGFKVEGRCSRHWKIGKNWDSGILFGKIL